MTWRQRSTTPGWQRHRQACNRVKRRLCAHSQAPGSGGPIEVTYAASAMAATITLCSTPFATAYPFLASLALQTGMAAAAQQQQMPLPMQGMQMPAAGVMPAAVPLNLLPPGLKQSSDQPQVSAQDYGWCGEQWDKDRGRRGLAGESGG